MMKTKAYYTVYNSKILDRTVGKTYNNNRKVDRMTEQPRHIIQYTIKKCLTK